MAKFSAIKVKLNPLNFVNTAESQILSTKTDVIELLFELDSVETLLRLIFKILLAFTCL